MQSEGVKTEREENTGGEKDEYKDTGRKTILQTTSTRHKPKEMQSFSIYVVCRNVVTLVFYILQLLLNLLNITFLPAGHHSSAGSVIHRVWLV